MSKSKDDNVAVAVLDYLVKQNRPYSAVDIFNNLHKTHGKTAVVKALEALSEERKIRSKTYGKQIVYVADQSQLPVISDDELKEMDMKIEKLQEKLKCTEDCYRKLESELRTLNNSMTTKDAKERLQEITAECARLEKKINFLKSNNNVVSPEERAEVLKKRTEYVKAWRKRKRMANDILEAILEGYPKKKKDLLEEIGVETDEEYDVKPPELI